jgi:hypothetical protein
MRTPAELSRDLDRALWLAVATGLLADLYLPVVLAGAGTSSPLGLSWPALVGLSLIAIVATSLRGVSWSGATLALGATAALFVATAVVLSFVPPVARDELTHHLAVPALFVRAGRMVEIPFADQAFYPMLVTLLYTPLVAHSCESAAKLLHLAHALGASALVCLYLRTHAAARFAVLGGVLLLTTPTVILLGSRAYVDLGLLFYAAVGFVAVLRWGESGRARYLVIAGLGAGCAATVKYNGVLLVPLLAAASVLLREERRAAVALRAAVTVGLLALVPLLPWLAKNLWQTGNPVYPLLHEWLGGRPLPSRPPIDVLTYRRVLYGESWPEIVLAPLRVFLTGRDGDPARFDGVFNPLFLLGFVAALLPGASRRARVLAAAAAAILLLVFFLTVLRSRYALPALVPLAVLAAGALQDVCRRGRVWRALAATATTAALAFNAVHLTRSLSLVDPLPYWRGEESRAHFIARFVPEYPVTAYANRHLPADATVYLAFLGQRGYYWQRSYTYDFHFSGIKLREAVEDAKEPDEIADLLQRQGISHIASADALLSRFMRENLNDGGFERWRRFAATHLRLLHHRNGVGLYEIV